MDWEPQANSTMTSLNEASLDGSLPFEGSQELKQTWNFAFVAYAYVIACVSSYSAVHLLDHSLWRAEELKKAAIIKFPDVYAAVMLSFGTVWCMHFVGMGAVTLEGVPICYNWLLTTGSLAVVVFLVLMGIKVAGRDVFATPDRERVLEQIVGNNYVSRHEASWALTKVTYFSRLQHVTMGSFLAASGAIVMHYTGMMAQNGPFRREWSVLYIGISVVMAIVICFAGFWIMFRLRWQIKQMWLRVMSAAVIALAVCTLHFFGMLSVTYYYDPDTTSVCERTLEQHNSTPNAWTDHQMIIVGISIGIPSIAFYISNIINQELILAYEVTARSNAIVNTLFPAQIRARMMEDEKSRLKNFMLKSTCKDTDLSESDMSLSTDRPSSSKPIAELFTDTTIMFADIAGFTRYVLLAHTFHSQCSDTNRSFTSWSSEREPCQVFQLLETLYQAFDDIAQKYGVFKVETVGDCYVAVCGLPEAREDHSVAMAQAATRCVYRMGILTKRLEIALGPDTGDLSLRVGLHSGPVTAGVLRGDRARFQLFGDTMNMASRMESTGLPGKIQVSDCTAELLRSLGKASWLTPREGTVYAKGKGEVCSPRSTSVFVWFVIVLTNSSPRPSSAPNLLAMCQGGWSQW